MKDRVYSQQYIREVDGRPLKKSVNGKKTEQTKQKQKGLMED